MEWFAKSCGGVAGKRICEIGNQHIWEHAARRFRMKHTLARDWMLDAGASAYVSTDINGEDGAIPIDLSKADLPVELCGRFDIVTNIGTSEHVVGQYPLTKEKVLKSQAHCFSNMYFMCKEGGVMIHQIPPVGHWAGHCHVRYKPDFPLALGRAFGGTIQGCEEVKLVTLNPNASLLMFNIRKESIHFEFFDPGEDFYDAIEVLL